MSAQRTQRWLGLVDLLLAHGNALGVREIAR